MGTRFRSLSGTCSSERGTALVEFALVIPILLVVLFGITDFGKAFNYWIDQTHLANEAARWAVVNANPGSGTLQQYILSQATTNELQGRGHVCISFPANPATGTSGKVGDPVRVTVTSAYPWLPFLGGRMRVTSTSISGTSTMRLEALPTNYSAGSGGTGGSAC
jgi:Flp pilus assembly protein TadG